MRTEREGLKAGSYVGGLLHLFDWNTKSRKKFTSKAELPKKLKLKKRFDGNLPTTRLQMHDGDEFAAGSSLKESSDYSCASSLTENDFYTSKAPNVVARLMGLDSLPTSNFLNPNFTSLPICQSSTSTHYKSKSLDFSEDFEFKCGNFAKRQTDDFRSEMLTPISAKPVSITYHKLPSPAKKSSFVPPNHAAEIIEASAGTIKPGPKASEKTDMPLRLRESKEKVQAVKKPSKSVSRHTSTRSLDGSVDYSKVVDMKDEGKSVSLALQAKANVQKRALVSHKEKSEARSTNRVLASQSQPQRCGHKKPSAQKSTNMLRPSNQKQNFPADSKKAPPLKSGSQGGKNPPMSNFSSSRQRNSGNIAGPTEVSSSKLASEARDDKKRVMSRSSAGVSHNKRSFNSNSRSQKNKPKGKSGNLVDSRGTTDIVSFTLRAQVERQGAGSVRSSISPSKRILLDPVGMGGPRFLSLGQSVNDMIRNTFLEGKLKELSRKEFSQQKIKNGVSADNLEGQPGSSYMQDGHSCSIITIQKCQVKYVDIHDRRAIFAERPSLDDRFPSPVSVLDHISITESSNSSETADSNSTRGGNHYSSIQFQEAELADSASSTSKAAAKTGSGTLNSHYHNKQRNVELIYIKKLLSNIEPMFNDYALGKTREIIKPRIFRQLEIQQKGHLNGGVESISRLDRRLIFDCVKECLDFRCGHFAKGGYELWAKGVFVVKRTNFLAENVYKDISCWGSMGHCMVDEIVGRDMSSKNGTWLDYDVDVFELGMKIESRLLSNLIDEVVDDILVL